MKPTPFQTTWLLIAATCLLAACDRSAPKPAPAAPAGPPVARPAKTAPIVGAVKTISPIVAAARTQVGRTTIYDPAYVGLTYPGGDVPLERGVCTDVVIRALRDARGLDLQKLVHEDMTRAFSKYPAIWGLAKPDRNIDHRRVPNLRRYLERQGCVVAISRDKRDYRPGDLVTCTVAGSRPHIMIVSDRRGGTGVPLVIHNIGGGAREENRLFDFPITGHYRIPGPRP